MRHRYRVDLYDDVELEARLVDLVESMPRSRRQEFLRTMIKVGFLNSYGASDIKQTSLTDSLPSVDSSRQRTPTALKTPKVTTAAIEKRQPKHTDTSGHQNEGRTTAPPDRQVKVDEVPHIEPKDENKSSKEDDFNIPSINIENVSESDIEQSKKSSSEGDDDDIVDSLDEFNGLFDGLNDA